MEKRFFYTGAPPQTPGFLRHEQKSVLRRRRRIWYLDGNGKASKMTSIFKAGVGRHFFGSGIPRQVASQQSQPPFHRTRKKITE
jgi:hypothetical protein